MDAYRRGLPFKLAEYAVKVYRGHRMIPNNITDQQLIDHFRALDIEDARTAQEAEEEVAEE
jgi:hypothetical protein